MMQVRLGVLGVGLIFATLPLGAQQNLYRSDTRISVSKEPLPPLPPLRVDVTGRDTTSVIPPSVPLPPVRLGDYLDMGEQELTAHMASRDTAEIMLAQLAAQKATDPNVRTFAAWIEGSRTAMLGGTIKVITEDHVGFQPRQRDYDLARTRELYQQLDAMPSGPSWDAAFVRTQYFLHANEFDVLTANIKNAHDDDLEDVIEHKQKVLTAGRDGAFNLAQVLGVSIP